METWTEDASVQLIELYQHNPLTWDPKHEDYYKKKIRRLMHGLVYCKNWESSNTPGEELNNNPKEELNNNQAEGQSNNPEEETDTHTESSVPFEKPRRFNQPGNKLFKSAVDVLNNVQKRLGAPTEVNCIKNVDKNTKAFTDFSASKMDSYSAQTKMAMQHAIFKMIMKADMGHYKYLHSQVTYRTGYHTGYSSNQYSASPSTSRLSTNLNEIDSSYQQPSSVDTQSTLSDTIERLSDFV
ncbi:hypothetical protein EVAR_69345_1 [Eumeta japonica]|uniref:MADF domain-containing protein n=1 Tax=Eumeta variegata TaxID=151549 RepID=A0A4C2A227_EUMVA|nr:hypothetical protein EVAR_69345_1 [Eumeta japonica]